MIKLVHGLWFMVHSKMSMNHQLQAKRTNHQSGEIIVVVVAALGVVLFTVLFIIAGAQIHFQNSSYANEAEKATTLAEAGVDKAITSINNTGGEYSGETETVLESGSYSVAITSKDAANKIIEATGYVPNKTNPRAKRTVKITASRGVGVAFVYGIQVGEGGLDLNSNNRIEGSVYSNGSIYANSNNEITGDAWVAVGPPGIADQETDCEGVNCQDYVFGKDVGGEERLDVAQSFKPSISDKLNKVSVKIKRTGVPADATVRIMDDKFGEPDKTKVRATGTLYSSLVTESYGFVDVTFDGTPQLETDKIYWLMIDTSANASNYWFWQNDLAQSYNRGQATWSPNWSAGNPTWTDITGDLSFNVYLGGEINSLRGNSNFTISGEAHANTIENATVFGDAYYQTILNSQVLGNSFPGSADPPPKTFPISEGNITQWKQQAQDAEVHVGDLNFDQANCPIIIESKKIVGNVTLNSNCTATVKSPIWITGNLTLNSNNILRLHSDYGQTSGVVIVDGTVLVNSNNRLEGTGQGSSILMVLSTYDSRFNDVNAVDVVSNGNTGVFYAHKGIIQPGTNNTFKELTAWKIRLVSNSTINYETGLSSSLFTSGPTGGYTLVKGTYQVK